ncbi:hypothetical protein JCM10213_003461 [Rhodosporidiobolus nylandii]
MKLASRPLALRLSAQSLPPTTPPAPSPRRSFPSPSRVLPIYLALSLAFLLSSLPILLRFSSAPTTLAWSDLSLDLKLALAARRVTWADIALGSGSLLDKVVYEQSAKTVLVLLAIGGRFSLPLVRSKSWTAATQHSMPPRMRAQTPSSLETAVLTLYLATHHLLATSLALSALAGSLSYLALFALSLLHELSWLLVLGIVLAWALATGKRVAVRRKLTRSTLLTVVLLLALFF